MLYRKNWGILQWIGLVPALLLQACSVGIDGGSIEKSFSGIKQATILGPQTAEINWLVNKNCSSYQVISLPSVGAPQEVVLPPVRIKNLVAGTKYQFSVACMNDGKQTGQDVTIIGTTLNAFNGVVTSSLDSSGATPKVKLNWTYSAATGAQFLVFAKKQIIPTDGATWLLTGNITSGYTAQAQANEIQLCSTYDQQVSIGTGGTCNPSTPLEAGQTYHFKVVARYPDQNFSNDVQGNFTSQTIPASFTAPSCSLTQTGLGADQQTSALFLKCTIGTTNGCNSYEFKAYQSLNGQRTSVSDTITAPGLLRIEAKIDASALNSRLVEGLEVEYTCKDTTANGAKVLVRYDQTSGNLQKPKLKYANAQYEKAPVQSYEQNPSGTGKAVAVGDFNCNGKPDLAIGFPEVTYNASPYFNKQSLSGMVKIIYDYADSAIANSVAPSPSPSSVQYLSFSDLPEYARFGSSLSAGNINKDVAKGGDQNYYNCDDLIIGAPSWSGARVTGSTFNGAAFIFYGHPQKFQTPLNMNDLTINVSTCSGDFDSKNCAPVRLTPDVTKWLKVHQDYTSQGTATNVASGDTAARQQSRSNFGHKVSYIRDFNADGYGDVAISDPYCDMDGEIAPGLVLPGNLRWYLREVGCVYVYWGGPNGLQTVDMGRTPDNISNLVSPFAKIYPPVPQAFMHFGWSISGGGDVNVAPPVPVKIDGNNLILASGHDFIVGAPDFDYDIQPSGQAQPSDTTLGSLGSLPTWAVNETNFATSVDPLVNQGFTQFNPNNNPQSPIIHSKMTPPWNKAWDPSGGWLSYSGNAIPTHTPLRNSTGIAFLYLGRTPLKTYDVKLGTDFRKYPNLVANGKTVGDATPQLAQNLFDRQNGSDKIEWDTNVAYDYQVNPKSSFYNCGSRGNPIGSNANGLFKGVSCLAGRNNVSWIYPALSATDAAVNRFGESVTIAGAKEQNLIALYRLGTAAVESDAYSAEDGKFITRKQGTIHDSIRGTPLWEVGVKGLNRPGASDTAYVTTDIESGNSIASTDQNRTGVLARAALSENYLIAEFTASPFKAQSDVNHDGYADVGVSATNTLFGYYGNYAADFAYHQNSNAGLGSCIVTNDANVAANLTTSSLGIDNETTVGSATVPYRTFTAFAKLLNTNPNSSLNYRYPYYFYPSSQSYRLSNLNDLGDNNYNFDYANVDRTTVTNNSYAAFTRCKPLKTQISGVASAMASADLNGDSQTDLLIGLPTSNSNAGQTLVVAGSGLGFIATQTYGQSKSNAYEGTSVAASNWKFIGDSGENRRRDLFTGSPGVNVGAGNVAQFSASGTNALPGSQPTLILQPESYPNDLMANRSKMVGDINGDGKEDILVPVRRVAEGGVVYFDGLLNFGSEFGSVNYAFCMQNLSNIKTINDQSITATDCLGAEQPLAVKMGGVNMLLPQYLKRPTGLTSFWIINTFPAGDVNNDGREDLVIIDGLNQVSPTGMSNWIRPTFYLFFGSTSGLINGPQPQLGPSADLKPQKISASFGAFSSSNSANSFMLSSFALGRTGNGGSLPSLQNIPITKGDYNGDGYQDLAIGMPGYDVPGRSVAWKCSTSDVNDPNNDACYWGGVPGTINQPTAVSPGENHGAVVVLYGASTGYQTNSVGGTPTDYIQNIALTNCGDFYQGCTLNDTVREVYDSLSFNNNWQINTNNTACTSGTCRATMIRNPIFYDFAGTTINVGSAMSYHLRTYQFGSALTTADINNDGVDDLLVGMPKYWLPTENNSGILPDSLNTQTNAPYTISGVGTTNDNRESQGRVMIYYGAASYGLVAPNAKQMLGDVGLGLASGGGDGTGFLHIPFAFYPAASANTIPTFDRGMVQAVQAEFGSAQFSHRNFGINLTTGDFNGDGRDDAAVVSRQGQLYVYYGPICGFDNSRNYALDNTTHGTYQVAANTAGSVPSTDTITGFSGRCSTLNFKNIGNENGNIKSITDSVVQAVGGSKLTPQMITMPGVTYNVANDFGSMLLSRRPIRSSTNQVLKNPGDLNWNNDTEKSSDLIIGSRSMNDPNANVTGGRFTGVGFVLFGNSSGLYVTNANYNSSLVTENNTDRYTPLFLRPHTINGETASFMYYPSSMGDINGDGTADLILPTVEIQSGAGTKNGVPDAVINGGGYQLYY